MNEMDLKYGVFEEALQARIDMFYYELSNFSDLLLKDRQRCDDLLGEILAFLTKIRLIVEGGSMDLFPPEAMVIAINLYRYSWYLRVVVAFIGGYYSMPLHEIVKKIDAIRVYLKEELAPWLKKHIILQSEFEEVTPKNE